VAEHLVALTLKLVLLSMGVAVWAHRHVSDPGLEPDAVAEVSTGRKALGLDEQASEFLQQGVQKITAWSS
jgi:hypothetical protein